MQPLLLHLHKSWSPRKALITHIFPRSRVMLLNGVWPRVVPGYATLLWFTEQVISPVQVLKDAGMDYLHDELCKGENYLNCSSVLGRSNRGMRVVSGRRSSQ